MIKQIVYALLYDIDYNNFDISGIYSTLEAAKAANPDIVEWRDHPTIKGMWEGFTSSGRVWTIEAHGLQ